jgi:hypothetical protein
MADSPLEQQPNFITTLLETVLNSFQSGLTEPVALGISSFISGSAFLLSSLVTLYFVLLGWRLINGKVDGPKAGEELMILFFSLGFFYYLPKVLPVFTDIIENGPIFLSTLFLPAVKTSSTAEAIATAFTTPWQHAWAMIAQPDVGKFDYEIGVGFVGVLLMAVILFHLVLSASLVFVNSLKLKLMLLVMPVFLVLYMFSETRKMTEGYVQIILTSLVTLFLIGLVLSFLSLSMISAVSGANLETTNDWVKAITQFLFSGVQLFLVKDIPTMATSIGGAYTLERNQRQGIGKALSDYFKKRRGSGGASEG